MALVIPLKQFDKLLLIQALGCVLIAPKAGCFSPLSQTTLSKLLCMPEEPSETSEVSPLSADAQPPKSGFFDYIFRHPYWSGVGGLLAIAGLIYAWYSQGLPVSLKPPPPAVHKIEGIQGKIRYVNPGESFTLDSGPHFYDVVHLRENAELVFRGKVVLVANQFISGKGARIRYEPGSGGAEGASLELHILDASQVHELEIEATGKEGDTPEGQAASGSNGGNAYHIGHSFSRPAGRSSSSGGIGGTGKPGGAGEPAPDVTVYLVRLRSSAQFVIRTQGGDGGKGQAGGRGGDGGRGARGHPPSRGGAGGRGGDGGPGGAQGAINVFLIGETQDPAYLKSKLSGNWKLESRPGAGGEGGAPGADGSGGDNGGSGHSRAADASLGAPGKPGQPGASEKKAEFTGMSDDDYRPILKQLQKIATPAPNPP